MFLSNYSGTIQAKQHSKNQKIYPTVMLLNFDPGNAKLKIKCSLYQLESGSDGVDYLHPHKLIMRSGENEKNDKCDPHFIEVGKQNDYTAM